MLALLLGLFPENGAAQTRKISVASGVPGRLADSLAIAKPGDVLNLTDA